MKNLHHRSEIFESWYLTVKESGRRGNVSNVPASPSFFQCSQCFNVQIFKDCTLQFLMRWNFLGGLISSKCEWGTRAVCAHQDNACDQIFIIHLHSNSVHSTIPLVRITVPRMSRRRRSLNSSSHTSTYAGDGEILDVYVSKVTRPKEPSLSSPWMEHDAVGLGEQQQLVIPTSHMNEYVEHVLLSENYFLTLSICLVIIRQGRAHSGIKGQRNVELFAWHLALSSIR